MFGSRVCSVLLVALGWAVTVVNAFSIFVPVSSRAATVPRTRGTALFEAPPPDGVEAAAASQLKKHLDCLSDDDDDDKPSDLLNNSGESVVGKNGEKAGANGHKKKETTLNGQKEEPQVIKKKIGHVQPVKTGQKKPEQRNGYKEAAVYRNGAPSVLKGKRNGGRIAPTAPEVNQWTTIMSDGTNAAINQRLSNRSRARKFDKNEAEQLEKIYKDLKDMSNYDKQQVQRYWDQLLPQISYLGTEWVAKTYDALRVAYRAHRGQMRKSGEPFIIHPVEVALLLAGLRMDGETIMAGLLHDTVEDTDLTFAQIESIFGHVVRSIVEGETKVSKLPKLAFSDYADEQAENLRQMFVAMTGDYRIIIVKLADRLHNMRTLRYMKPEKQIKISRETLDIFAPLAHRMGIWQFKSELEDTAFMYLYPQEYKRLNRRLRVHQTKFRDTLKKSKQILKSTLEQDPTLKSKATFQVHGRTKELYSLWHKMETKGERNLDHIVDVVALRVILTPNNNENNQEDDPNIADRGVWLCYHVLGLVQHLPGFQPMPTRVKDYISFPKPNGYQSLHTALMLNGQAIEVQIRTSAMHQVAEYGMASHWAYTDVKKRPHLNQRRNDELYNTPWLSSIKEWQDDIVCSRDFVDSVRRELLGKRVFVFLRNGKILNLARGATAIDAAFQIHTEVGLNMHGVEINGKPVPFSYELHNGDVVSILTGEGKPATDWMRYAKSRSTRSKLRSYFREKQVESLREAGRILLMDYLWMHGPLIEKYSFLKDLAMPTTVEGLTEFLPGNTRISNIDDLLIGVGKKHDRMFLHTIVSKIFLVPLSTLVDAERNRGSPVPNSVVAAVHESRKMAREAARAAASAETSMFVPVEPTPLSNTTLQQEDLYQLDDESVEYADPEHLCKQCLPVHGDDIIGTAPSDDQSIVTVHRMGCLHAQRAVNHANAANTNTGEKEVVVDSVMLRALANGTDSGFSNEALSTEDVLVKLRWPDLKSYDDKQPMFSTEMVVVAEDRKLLLADCSEVVSELSEILKTGSTTSKEHATLVFLVKVSSLEHLQQLMDSLRQIRSVMSVERRFGSEL